MNLPTNPLDMWEQLVTVTSLDADVSDIPGQQTAAIMCELNTSAKRVPLNQWLRNSQVRNALTATVIKIICLDQKLIGIDQFYSGEQYKHIISLLSYHSSRTQYTEHSYDTVNSDVYIHHPSWCFCRRYQTK